MKQDDKHAVAGYFGVQVYKADDNVYFDNIHICKYTSPEPLIMKHRVSGNADVIRAIVAGLVA